MHMGFSCNTYFAGCGKSSSKSVLAIENTSIVALAAFFTREGVLQAQFCEATRLFSLKFYELNAFKTNLPIVVEVSQ